MSLEGGGEWAEGRRNLEFVGIHILVKIKKRLRVGRFYIRERQDSELFISENNEINGG